MKRSNSEDTVVVTFEHDSETRSYKLHGNGGHTAEMLVQLLCLGDVDSLRLEPVRLELADQARIQQRRECRRSYPQNEVKK